MKTAAGIALKYGDHNFMDALRKDIESFAKDYARRAQVVPDELLVQVNSTLLAHGKIDANTPLHDRIQRYFDTKD